MFQAFVIVLREGFEAFLIVAITITYLRKTTQDKLLPAVFWGIFVSFIASGLLGFWLWKGQGLQAPMVEGIFALVTAVLVSTLVIHMWKAGPQLKNELENKLAEATTKPTFQGSFIGVFLFTVLMISREGMETALLLLQVHSAQVVTGAALGLLGAAIVAMLWQQFGYLISMKHFFQVTSVYLLLFIAQVLLYAFHEFTETGLMPNAEYLHEISEPFSPDGYYGKWFSTITIVGCGLWLVGGYIAERLVPAKVKV